MDVLEQEYHSGWIVATTLLGDKASSSETAWFWSSALPLYLVPKLVAENHHPLGTMRIPQDKAIGALQ